MGAVKNAVIATVPGLQSDELHAIGATETARRAAQAIADQKTRINFQ
jgi:hypothetical protein